MSKNKLTKQSENFPQWYQDVVYEAELADTSEVRGCGIIRPYGLKIWELIKAELSRLLEADGVENVYFPIFVPLENLMAEKEHIEGFAPELAIVTHGGGEELVNKLAIRPTSEAAMYKTYAKWLQSYKDLPMRYNQWANVVRWEKRPRAFLRWSEFLWQEGHTVFADEASARIEVDKILGFYTDVYKFMALPVFAGRKSENEKFAGAVTTKTVELMSKDGKAIQGATSHYLGTNFSKAFDVKYLGADGESHFGYQNSWGLSWRSVGALIMGHGDDNGLRLPPSVAPIQIIIIPIYKDDEAKNKVLSFCAILKNDLAKIYRVKVDDREALTPGFKFNHWEVRGVPVRLEIGPREVEDGVVSIYRRDTGEKTGASLCELTYFLEKLMVNIQDTMYSQALAFATSHIYRIENLDEIDNRQGWFEASWSEDEASEKLLKEKFGMVSRVLLSSNENQAPKNKKCFITGGEAKHDWYFAKSY